MQKIIFILLLLIISCGENTDSKKISDKPNKKEEVEVKSDSIKIDILIFGVFCAECPTNCATMFKLDLRANNPSLYANHTRLVASQRGTRSFNEGLF